MAGKIGSSADAIAFLTDLEREPYRFDFFQVLRRLEAMHPDKPGLGRSARPADDPVRLAQEPTLKFAPSTISGFVPGVAGRPDRLESYFFGLFGPNGPLPTHLTEYALQRKLNEEDATFAHFADLFHHRMLSFLYRAWADARPTVQFDRPDGDRFSVYVGTLFGVGTPSLRGRDVLGNTAKLQFAGVLAAQTRNAEGLRAILQEFFKVAAEIEECRGGWMALPDNCYLRLGTDANTGMLGVNAVTGGDVWGCQQRFRIVLGPMGIVDLRRLLPGSDSISRLVALVRGYVGDEKDWDLNLVLLGKEVPRLELGNNGRLGWTTWLGTTAARPETVDDVVLTPTFLADGLH